MGQDLRPDHLYSLVSLQIGDMQSYVARLFLLLACDKSKLVFLVDNGPWTAAAPRSRSTKLWMLVVTKSRTSPFANHRLKRARSYELTDSKEISPDSPEKTSSRNWDTVLRSWKSIVRSEPICAQFQGCVAFEVQWTDVRGINYANELQTDTCLSLEVRSMSKKEFESLDEALRFYDPQYTAVRDQESSVDTPQSSGRCKRAKFHDSRALFSDDTSSSRVDSDAGYHTPAKSGTRIQDSESSFSSPVQAPESSPQLSRRRSRSNTDPGGVLSVRQVPVAHVYKDVFVVFRFSDAILPFELKNIITANQTLLKMLESGLPSWVMFLQSYPGFSHIYRPWMRPLARTVYFLISIVTVMIGFYDLYKNVPVLKVTAAHMLGPLFRWVESWEMVSRLKYLGTMLVLQNYEKAFLFINAVRKLISLLMRPILEPLRLLWSFFVPLWASLVEWIHSVALMFGAFFDTLLAATGSALQLVIWPFGVFLSTVWKLGCTIASPVISVIQIILLLVLNTFQVLSEFGAAVTYNLVLGAWQTLVPTGQAVLKAGSPIVSAPKTPSLWRALWDDLFSKVFRAVRYILNGLVAFFTSLNRHRLSIYNNMVAFLARVVSFLESGKRLVHDAWSRLLLRDRLQAEEKED